MTTYPILPDNCIIATAYTGVKDYDTTYLGFDNFLATNPVVTLSIAFESDEDAQYFFDWWEQYTFRGTGVFIVPTKLFGRHGSYGVRQTTQLSHTEPNVGKVTFSVEVLFDENTVDNAPPTAISSTIYVYENSLNNFLLLTAADAENDELTYQVKEDPVNGTYTGVPPNLLYTPINGFVGTDTIVFSASDVFNEGTDGTITIEVSNITKAEAEFTYTVTGDLGVSGNFHYDLGDGAIRLGGGGNLTPILDTIKIWSNNHKIDDRTDVVTGITINNWGNRTDFTKFTVGQTGLSSFTVSNAIGTCKGVIFDNMFENFGLPIPLFDTSNGIYFREFFLNATLSGIPAYDFSNGVYFQRCLKGSSIKNTQYLNTVKGQYFQEFLKDSGIECMGGINTLNKINTSQMFDNTTSLVNPDGTEQIEILNGADWTSAAACVMTLNDITEEVEAVGDVDIIDGTVLIAGQYKITYNDHVGGTPAFNWTCEGGTITAGQGTDTVTVSNTVGVDTEIYVQCTVTDSIGGVTSPLTNFTQHITYLYLILDIPYQATKINLRSFIDANNPESKTEVLLTNTRTLPTTETGDLTGLNVEYRVTGEIQALVNSTGFLDSNTAIALEMTSPIKLIMSGAVRACGGKGGTGGKGANSTKAGSAAAWSVKGTHYYTPPANYVSGTLCMIGGGEGGMSTTYDNYAGGGHAGSIYNANISLAGGVRVTVVVGTGGVSGGGNGTASKFGTYTANGGSGATIGAGSQYAGTGAARSTCRGTFYDGGSDYQWYGGQAGFANGGKGQRTSGGSSNGALGSGGGSASPSYYTAGKGGDGYVYLTTVQSVTGGNGGAGGMGAGFNNPTADGGVAGGASWPTGGYAGGTGGTGGSWAAVGSTGGRGNGSGAYGTAGTAAGKAIVGLSFMKAGSAITGTVNGSQE